MCAVCISLWCLKGFLTRRPTRADGRAPIQSTVVENASDSDDKNAHAADSGRDDSWLTRRTDLATLGKGRHERSMWKSVTVDEKNGAADSEREDWWLARQADPGTGLTAGR